MTILTETRFWTDISFIPTPTQFQHRLTVSTLSSSHCQNIRLMRLCLSLWNVGRYVLALDDEKLEVTLRDRTWQLRPFTLFGAKHHWGPAAESVAAEAANSQHDLLIDNMTF